MDAKRTISALLLLLPLLAARDAGAALVDFTTTPAILSCGTATDCTPGAGNVINFGLSTGGAATLQVTYSANIENDLNVDPTASTNVGQLFLLCVSCAGQTGSFDLTGATLDLSVAQGPDPFVGAGSLGVGMLSGSLTLDAGKFGGVAQVRWPDRAAFAIDDGTTTVTYILQQPTPPRPAAYLLSINAATTLQGLITTLPYCASGLTLENTLFQLRSDGHFLLYAQLVLPPSVTLDPASDGLLLAVKAATDMPVLEVTAPPGAGWTVRGTVYSYSDDALPLRSAIVQDKSAEAPGSTAVLIRGELGPVALPDPEKLSAALFLAPGNGCGTVRWNPPAGTRPRCRTQGAQVVCY